MPNHSWCFYKHICAWYSIFPYNPHIWQYHLTCGDLYKCLLLVQYSSCHCTNSLLLFAVDLQLWAKSHKGQEATRHNVRNFIEAVEVNIGVVEVYCWWLHVNTHSANRRALASYNPLKLIFPSFGETSLTFYKNQMFLLWRNFTSHIHSSKLIQKTENALKIRNKV